MIRSNSFLQHTALCVLLLCFSFSATADDMQEANKLFKNGQQSLALAKVNNILANRPKDAQARFLKGVIMTDQGQTEAALNIFSALTKDYPELPEPYNNLAVIYANKGEFEKARTALEAALHTHPSYSTAHENLGDIYAKMASQAYNRALQLDPGNENSIFKLVLLKDIYTPAIKTAGDKMQIASLSNSHATSTTAAVAKTPVPDVPDKTSAEPVPAKPAPTKAVNVKPVEAAIASSNNNDDILHTVQNWAKAWSSRNADKYLSMYAQSFKTPDNQSRSIWEQQRRERIDKPQPIVVTIINPKIKVLDETLAKVSFIQSYRSGKLKSTTRKTLTMIRENNVWKIQSEQTGL